MSLTSILNSSEEELLAKAIKRVHQMDSTWLMDFADQSATGMQIGIEDFRRLQQIESMTEIKGGLLALLAAVCEIEDRWRASSQQV